MLPVDNRIWIWVWYYNHVIDIVVRLKFHSRFVLGRLLAECRVGRGFLAWTLSIRAKKLQNPDSFGFSGSSMDHIYLQYHINDETRDFILWGRPNRKENHSELGTLKKGKFWNPQEKYETIKPLNCCKI